MNDVLSRYIQCFLHPREAQKSNLGRNSDESNVVSIHGQELGASQYQLSFEEGLSFSWLFAVIQAFYIILIMALGIQVFTAPKSSLGTVGSHYAVKIFFVVIEVVFFPLSYWFYTKFWSKIIHLCSQMFSLESPEGVKACEDIAVKSMTAYCLLIVPFFGQLFSQLVMAIYLFQGMKARLNFSSLQAFFVMLVPMFLIFLSIVFMVIALVITIAGVR